MGKRYIFCSIICLLSLGLVIPVVAQDEVTFFIDQENIEQDSLDEAVFYVPIGVANFSEIKGIDLQLSSTDENGRLEAILNLNPNLAGLNNAIELDTAGNTLAVFWFDQGASGTGATLPDSSFFLVLQMRLSGEPGDCFPLSFTFLEVVQGDNIIEAAPSVALDGEVCIPEFIALGGRVFYPNMDEPGLASVIIEVEGPEGLLLRDTTDAMGNFFFAEVPIDSDFEIRALEKIDETTRAAQRQGINVGDLVAIQDHRLGRTPFVTPYQYIAADVSRSVSVGIIDAVQIRTFILSAIDNWPQSQPWYFIDAGLNIANGLSTEELEATAIINLNAVAEDTLDINFIGVKAGDVNFSAY